MARNEKRNRVVSKRVNKASTKTNISFESYRMLQRDWLTLSTHLIWCYDHIVPSVANNPISNTSIDKGYTRAWLVRKGKIQITMQDHMHYAHPGEWLILNGEPQRRTISPGTHILSVAFVSAWPNGSSLFDTGLPLVVKAAHYPKLEHKLKKVARTMNIPEHTYSIREQPMDYRTNLALQRDFSDWLLTFLDVLQDHKIVPTGHYSYDNRVIHAMRLIDAAPLGKPFNQETIAAVVGLSTVHLTRLFASDLRMTPKAYFENRRYEHAQCHLSVTDAQIKAIAYSLGFHDLSHFNKWFRKRAGCSPKEYTQAIQSLP